MKMVARQNDCGGGCGHGTNNFTVKWTNSCATTVYVWAANYFLAKEDFTGGFVENVPEGWTQIQDGSEDSTHFKMFFDGNFNIPQNILNKVELLGGINEVTFPVEDLWVGGLAVCREQSGPCGYPQTVFKRYTKARTRFILLVIFGLEVVPNVFLTPKTT